MSPVKQATALRAHHACFANSESFFQYRAYRLVDCPLGLLLFLSLSR
jgi:hypothetical protein